MYANTPPGGRAVPLGGVLFLEIHHTGGFEL